MIVKHSRRITMPENTTERFRTLLKKGMGTRTQTEFAHDCGFAQPMMNRLLNGKNPGMLKLSTLEHIAAAMYSVSLNDLLSSLNMPQITGIERVARDARKINKLAASIEKDEGGKKFKENEMAALLEKHLPAQVVCRVTAGGTGHLYKCPGKYPDADTYFLFQFIYSDKEYAGAVYILGYFYSNFDGHTFYGFETDPEAMEKAAGRKIFPEENDFTQVVRNAVCYTKTKDNYDAIKNALLESKGKTVVDRFRDIIMYGEYRDDTPRIRTAHMYPQTVTGFGIRYDKTPESFVDYLNANAGFFCRNEEETQMYEELNESADADPDEIFAGCMDNRTHACGTGAAIAKILTRQIASQEKMKFHYFCPDKATCEEYGLEENRGYILCFPGKGQDYTDEDVSLNVRITVYSLCRALGVPKFGTYHAFFMVPEKEKTYEYTTSEYHFEFKEQ